MLRMVKITLFYYPLVFTVLIKPKGLGTTALKILTECLPSNMALFSLKKMGLSTAA